MLGIASHVTGCSYRSVSHILCIITLHAWSCAHNIHCNNRLNPEKDPLCALLIIDYCAVRSGEYQFLIDLFNAWEVSSVQQLNQIFTLYNTVSLTITFSLTIALCLFKSHYNIVSL